MKALQDSINFVYIFLLGNLLMLSKKFQDRWAKDLAKQFYWPIF